jgi:hypothetical protein
MLQRFFAMSLLGTLSVIGAGCTTKSADQKGEAAKTASLSANTKEVTLAVTGMT